jgi:hypothetical protein
MLQVSMLQVSMLQVSMLQVRAAASEAAMGQAHLTPERPARTAPLGATSLLSLPDITALRVARAMRPLTDRWRQIPVEPRRTTLLGISFRPRQADTLGLDARSTLRTLLSYPFQLIRLGAYWDRMEPEPDQFRPDELDWQIDAAEQAGKQIIVCVGAVKTFGYPEFFVPAHQLQRPLREGALIRPDAHRSLLSAATAFVTRVVERYRDRQSIVAWQVEHEAVDPLGFEHWWRLSAAFVQEEVAAVRAADPSRPIMMNGFLQTSWPAVAIQTWRTRDQGDSLSAAQRMADIVGIDYYPRLAMVRIGPRTVYLDGSRSPSHRRTRGRLFAWAAANGHRLMIAEGQAEPWETVSTPPNPEHSGMYSCLPEHVIENYNQCMRWDPQGTARLYAYLFWGAEYWVLREACGDPRYMQAFARVLADA